MMAANYKTSVECPRCHAPVGRKCRYPSPYERSGQGYVEGLPWTGRETPRVHSERSALIRQAAPPKAPITTCQICGRGILSKKGLIAHHGYTRPGGGWQTASCMGARHLPYEQSCDVIPVAIGQVKSYLTAVEKSLREHIEHPREAFTVYKRGLWNNAPTGEVDRVPRPADFDPKAKWRSYMPNSYDTLWHDVHYKLETDIRDAKSDLKFLEDRLAAWKAPKDG